MVKWRSSMTTTQLTGMRGEEAAVAYLSAERYDVRERNARFGRLEIDIIAYDRAEKMIVFVEVKTRSRHTAAYPIHTAVDVRKRRAMRAAMWRWVIANDFGGAGRIDVISVSSDRIVEHIKDLGSDFY